MDLEEFIAEVKADSVLTDEQKKVIKSACRKVPSLFMKEFGMTESVIRSDDSTSRKRKKFKSQVAKIRSKMEKYDAIQNLKTGDPESLEICLSLAKSNKTAVKAIRTVDRLDDEVIDKLSSFLIGCISGEETNLDGVREVMHTNDRLLLKRLKDRDYDVVEDLLPIIKGSPLLTLSGMDVLTDCCTIDRLTTLSDNKYKIFRKVISWLLGIGSTMKSIGIDKLRPRSERYRIIIDEIPFACAASTRKIKSLISGSNTLSTEEMRIIINALDKAQLLSPFTLATLKEVLMREVNDEGESTLLQHLARCVEADTHPKENVNGYLIVSFSLMVLWTGLSVFGIDHYNHLLSFVLLAVTTTPLVAVVPSVIHRSMYVLLVTVIGMSIVAFFVTHHDEELMIISWLCLMLSWFGVCLKIVGVNALRALIIRRRVIHDHDGCRRRM